MDNPTTRNRWCCIIVSAISENSFKIPGMTYGRVNNTPYFRVNGATNSTG
jgi:hypothetical protein